MAQLPYINLAHRAVSELAHRYALALVEAAADSGVIDSVARDIQDMKTLWRESELFRRFAGYPEIVRARAAGIVDVLAATTGWQSLTCRFLVLLAQHKRLTLIPKVVEAFVAAHHAHRGESMADVITAAPLSDDQRLRIEAALQPLGQGRLVVVKVHQNPSLLGGMVVVHQSHLIDASLTGRLRRAAHALATRGTIEPVASLTPPSSPPSRFAETVV